MDPWGRRRCRSLRIEARIQDELLAGELLMGIPTSSWSIWSSSKDRGVEFDVVDVEVEIAVDVDVPLPRKFKSRLMEKSSGRESAVTRVQAIDLAGVESTGMVILLFEWPSLEATGPVEERMRLWLWVLS